MSTFLVLMSTVSRRVVRLDRLWYAAMMCKYMSCRSDGCAARAKRGRLQMAHCCELAYWRHDFEGCHVVQAAHVLQHTLIHYVRGSHGVGFDCVANAVAY